MKKARFVSGNARISGHEFRASVERGASVQSRPARVYLPTMKARASESLGIHSGAVQNHDSLRALAMREVHRDSQLQTLARMLSAGSNGFRLGRG